MSLTVRLRDTTARHALAARLPALLASAGSLVVVALAYGVFADRPVMEADLSTYLLPGRSLLDGGGSLYVDYFDIKPPLTYALLVPWLAVAGPSLLGWWVLYALLLLAMFAAQWLLLRTVLGPWLALVAFASMAFVFVGESVLEELFFITEVMGLVLVLWGLLLAVRRGPWWLLAGAALVTAAGQVKEVFILAPLAVIPLALSSRRGRLRGLAWAAGGVAAATALTVVVMVAWGDGVLAAYGEVLGLKRDRFAAPGVGGLFDRSMDYVAEVAAWLPLLVVFAAAILVTALALRRRRGQPGDEVPGWTLVHTSFVVLFAGIAAGFVWQGAPLIRHYAVAVIPPLFLLLGALLGWAWPIVASVKQWWGRVLAAALIVGLVPAVGSILWAMGAVTGYSPARLVASAGALESDEALAGFRRVAEATVVGDCIQVAYGWSASAYHWYSGRPPCARFFVPPLDLTPDLRREYQQALITRPPDLIVYDPVLAVSTTVPAEEGTPDEVVFPFAAVVASCYEPVPGDPLLFRPRGTIDVASQCIADQVSREIRS
jgi:hypothetical protein